MICSGKPDIVLCQNAFTLPYAAIGVPVSYTHLYELTGDTRFLSACETQADYIEKYFVDRIHGDWYNNVIVDETGLHIVDGMHGFDKLNGGKCPFHNSQMCFEVMERTARLLKKEDS